MAGVFAEPSSRPDGVPPIRDQIGSPIVADRRRFMWARREVSAARLCGGRIRDSSRSKRAALSLENRCRSWQSDGITAFFRRKPAIWDAIDLATVTRVEVGRLQGVHDR